MTEERGTKFHVTLDSGDEIEHSYEDITAALCDYAPAWVSLGDHVIAMSPMANASKQYLLGFVSRDFCQEEKELYEITFDNSQRGNYTLKELRKLPFFSSVRQGNEFFFRFSFLNSLIVH